MSYWAILNTFIIQLLIVYFITLCVYNDSLSVTNIQRTGLFSKNTPVLVHMKHLFLEGLHSDELAYSMVNNPYRAFRQF